MRFVDRDDRQIDPANHLAKGVASGAFRRDVEQVELAVPKRIPDCARIVADAGQGRGMDTKGLRRSDLVLHQGD